jgi:PAS domain S-box-containing protein
MKIRNQFLISTAIFSIVLLIVVLSVVAAEQELSKINKQQSISETIEKDTDELNTISNKYFLYQQTEQVAYWESNITLLQSNLSNLSITNSKQQTYVNNAVDALNKLNAAFIDTVSFLESAPRNVSVRIIPEFQNDWNRTVTNHQAFALNVSQLLVSLRARADQLRFTNITITVSLLGVFGAFFLTNYFITYRRILKSISKLQAGINIIGSGKLDFSVKTDKSDEIGELSSSFNNMATNLKKITASKNELEKEIAERKKASEALVQSEQKYRRLYETTQDGIMARDLQGRMIDCNQAYARMLGYSKLELEQLAAQKLIHEKWHEQREKVINEVLERGESVVFEREYTRKDGSIFPASVRTWRLTDEGGKIVGIWSIVRDITEQKELQKGLQLHAENLEKLVEERTNQLKDAERLAAIGQTAGMVGHDIRNPLQAITSDVYLLKSELGSMPQSETKERVQESLEGIENNVYYINKIVLDLQDYAGPMKPVAHKANLEDLCEELLLRKDMPENIKTSCHVEKGAKMVYSDSDVLKRILNNLVTNAVQAMPKGGDLAIHAKKELNEIIIEVQDSGEGIPEEVKPKIFAPLFTTKSKGQGFGLAVVKRMTEALGGTITFESEEGKGTKFSIRLPSTYD